MSATMKSDERVINLAMYLSDRSRFVSADEIRYGVAGYDSEASKETFDRMFSRDKDVLRSCGFTILVSGDEGYRIDPASTFANELEFSPDEAAALRAVGSTLLDDQTFPFANDLRLALAKIAGELGGTQAFAARQVSVEETKKNKNAKASSGISESSANLIISTLQRACVMRKKVSFTYTNSKDSTEERSVDPYGLFSFSGTWYLVAFDPSRQEIRVFRSSRIVSNPKINTKLPGTPDFEQPDFDIKDFIGLPFQYGNNRFDVTFRFEPDFTWRAPRLILKHGTTEETDDGLLWHIEARDLAATARWAIEVGPGITPVAPPELVDVFRKGLERVEKLHG